MVNNFDQIDTEIQENPIDWRELFEKYIVYWKWILASLVFAFIIGFFYIRTQENSYELSTTLLVVDQTKSGGMNEMSMLKQFNSFGTGSIFTMVNNENEVVKSSALMEKVVHKLELHTTYSEKSFLRNIELYTASPYYVRMDSVALSRIEYPLSLTINREDGIYTLEVSYKDTSYVQNIKKLPVLINTPAGPISIALRTFNVIPTTKIFVKITNPDLLAKSISSNQLETEVSKLVDVINIKITTNNVKKGKDILNTLNELYNQDAIEQINRAAINTANFIDDRLRLISLELSDVEGEVENYKQANQMTDMNSDAKIYLERNNDFDQQSIIVENQLSLIRFVEEFINKRANQYALIPNLGLTDVGLVAVIQKYNELVMSRERIADGTTEENPTLRTLNQQIVSARRAIQVSIANSRKGMEITKGKLDQQNTKAVSKIRDLPRQEREFIQIKRQQQVKESLYLFLLQKREEASLTMAITVPKGRVLNSPGYLKHIGPQSKIILLIFMILGIIFPILVIYLRDLFNNKITTCNQLEKHTDVPILSELGHNEGPNIIIEHDSNTDTNAELFRLLRTKLQFALDYPTENVILVTSTEPGEGKSFVSLNLAISLSLNGKKVMLLGLDLRKPQLKKHLNLMGKEGMSSILSGNEKNYKNLIQRVDKYPTLEVIPGGIIPPNPNELLMNKRLEYLIASLRKEYDYIVIDTAPVGSVSDTFLIDRVVDISLYMCRMDYSDKRNIDFLNHINADKSLKRPFIVINDMKMDSKYYYHKGYSNGYGKYYGHDKEGKK